MSEAVTGPAFPFAIDPATGGVAMTSGTDKLADNIRLILGMRVGERPMNRNFGTPIRALVHEPNDGGLARLISRYARETLAQLEPRIRVIDVRFQATGGEAVLELRYMPVDRPESQLLLIPLG